MIAGQRRGVLRLTGIETAAFSGRPMCQAQWPFARRFALWLTMVVNVAVYEKRVSSDGNAVCLLSRIRAAGWAWAASIAGAIFAAVVAALILAPLALVGFVILGGFLSVPSILLGRRAAPARDVLKACTPPGKWIPVHSVASKASGSGRLLMEALCAEADAEAWGLILDAANPHLADYYKTFGFRAVSEPTAMPWGESVVRMVRSVLGPLEVAV